MADAARLALQHVQPELGALAEQLGRMLASLVDSPERERELVAMVSGLWFGPDPSPGEGGRARIEWRRSSERAVLQERHSEAALPGEATINVTRVRVAPDVVAITVRNEFVGLPSPAGMEKAVRGILGIAELRPSVEEARAVLEALFPATVAALALDLGRLELEISDNEGEEGDCRVFLPFCSQTCAALYPGLWATLSRVVCIRVAVMDTESDDTAFVLTVTSRGIEWAGRTRGEAVVWVPRGDEVAFSLDGGEPHAFRLRVSVTLSAALGLAKLSLPAVELEAVVAGRDGGGLQARLRLLELEHLTAERVLALFVPITRLREMLLESLRVDFSVAATDGGHWKLFLDADARAPPISSILVAILRAVVVRRLGDKVRLLQSFAAAVGTDLSALPPPS